MAHLLEGVSPKIPMRSAILGAFSLFLQFLGYFSLSAYMYGRSRLYGSILFVSIAFFIVLGTAHLAAIVTGTAAFPLGLSFSPYCRYLSCCFHFESSVHYISLR